MYNIAPRARFSSSVGNGLFNSASLDLHFAKTKDLVDATTGASLVTFTRASSGTFVGSDGVLQTAATNEPRFDHNPTTGESLGLLVEEARTNLCLYSQAISTAPWAANGLETCVSSTLTDPAGGLNAFKINTSGTGSFERWQQPITVVNGTTYTLSAWVRSTAGTALFRLRFAGGVTSSDLTATTTWQRFTYTLTAGTTAGFFALNAPSTSAATEIHVYGAQLEAGAGPPTSYIPTTTAAATRSADVASITGTAFSSWYRQDEGTVFADAPGIYSTGSVFTFSDGSNNNRTLLDHGTNTRRTRFISGNIEQAAFSPSYIYGTQLKTGISYASNYFSMANAGVLASGAPDTSCSLPVGIDRIFIGSNSTGAGQYANTTIRRLTFWPTRLPDNTLQSITQ